MAGFTFVIHFNFYVKNLHDLAAYDLLNKMKGTGMRPDVAVTDVRVCSLAVDNTLFNFTHFSL